MLIDRYILGRFFTNFAILFVLLFFFAAAIDNILNLDEFVEAARDIEGEDAGTWEVAATLLRVTLDFQAPRFFQFFAYLHGLVAIGAMAFTLAQMFRNKEIVALLAAGMSMHRIAMPFIIGMFSLSLIQLVNQETMLPKVAPLLLRGHGEIGTKGARDFEVLLMADARSNLWHAASFDPVDRVLTGPTILERDARGRTIRRISAARANWNADEQYWVLEDGREVVTPSPEDGNADRLLMSTAVETYASDITPEILTIQRYNQFAAMLSLRQIAELLDMGVTNGRSLRRYQYARFSAVLVNVLVMVIALPSFLLREPTSLMQRSIVCASLSITCMMGAAFFMMADIAAMRPAVSVFLPVIVLFPVALGRITTIHT
ncbi:MAG: LptF/LptG family permease [Planctomycetota bacterium]